MATGSKITAIQVQNFKSIGKTPQTLNIRPLTIVAGANSSGKSTLMQPLLLLKQTLESEFASGPLRLDGPHLRLSQVDQVISQVPGADKQGFQFGFQLWNGGWLGFQFKNSRSAGFQLKSNTWRTRGQSRGETIVPGALRSRAGPFAISTHNLDAVTVGALPQTDALRAMFQFSRAATRVFHVRGVRAQDMRTQRNMQAINWFVGPFDVYAASVIYQWKQDQSVTELTKLNNWLTDLALTNRIEALKVDDVAIELKVGRLASALKSDRTPMVSIADVGFGVSQVLPALVALLIAHRDGLIFIEQPELHLHPNPQVKLAHIFAEMASIGGASIVVETHSSLLIREIQTLVAKGKLDPNIVSLNWCNRDPKTGATKVTEAKLERNGTYGDWPIDFDDVALDTDRRFLDASLARKRR